MLKNRTLLIIVGLLGVVALALACLLGYYFFFRPSTPPPPADDSLARIQEAGKIVVGTSADYLPFEYYLSDFQLDGFDIALMEEIAQRLGVRPEYRNFAFDGLGNALQLKQIDVAIAAISVNPERAAVVEFSNVYLVTEDAILATSQAQITIDEAQDLAGLRIGVQSATVHERWAQTNLVDPGIVKPGDLLVYEQFVQAVGDLLAGRIDLLIADLPVAQAAASADNAVIVGQGLNPQRLALALPKGATSLKAEIDRVLTDLHNEGRVAALAQEYLDLDELLPTPTPGPEPLPTPVGTPVVCIDSLALVEHLNLDDQNMSAPPQMQPGQAFTKGWRVRNAGTCTWDSDYRLVYANGSDPASRMGGEPVALTRPVGPEETYDIQLNLIAPLQPGTYRGFWQLANGWNMAFGERLPVGISVPVPATPTPAPTQTPAPGIDFRVDRTNIKAGECVIFTWQVENVREVYFYAQGEPWQDNGVSGNESRTVCPPVSTIYELRVVNLDGAVEIRQITIYVEQVVGAPAITRFTVDPEPQIIVGQCVDIRWEVKGEVDRVKLTANNADLWDGAPTSGSQQNCPPGAGTVAYGLEASGSGGTSRQQRTIKVVEAAATPAPTPEPEAPVINAFEVVPNQLEVGGCVNLSWRAGGGTSRVQLKRDGGVVLDNAPFEGSVQDCNLSQPATVIYRVEASNSAGQAVFQEESVNVSEAKPDNPLAGTSWQLRGTLEGSSITASFGADGSLNGSAGCNSYSSEYIASGLSLAITPPTSSQSICGEPEGIMEQEALYLSTLPAAGNFEIQGNALIIQDSAGKTIMEFSRL